MHSALPQNFISLARAKGDGSTMLLGGSEIGMALLSSVGNPILQVTVPPEASETLT